MAIKIQGNWSNGYVLDLHTESSEYIGMDEYGHDKFDTKRTVIGEMVYKLKYKSDKSVLPDIIDAIKKSIKGIDKMDFIIAVPPSVKSRTYQPVYLICEYLSKDSGIAFLKDVIINENIEELKNISDPEKRKKILKKSLSLNSKFDLSNKKILLIDDLYRSGATLNAVTDILLEKGQVEKVSVLALTKTRSIT